MRVWPPRDALAQAMQQRGASLLLLDLVFNVELSLANADTLKVFGYAGIRLVSETLMWKRLPPDSARCKSA